MKYHHKWEDMSDYLVHFSSSRGSESAYEAMLGILFTGQLRASNPFGFAKGKLTSEKSKNCVCLSETPLHLLQRISSRRGPYGIGFSKSFISSLGGNPILYVQSESSLYESFEKLLRHSAKEPHSDLAQAFWNIAPFVDRVISTPVKKYEFQWEREWRVCDDINFETTDVAFLVIPEDLHYTARNFFDNAEYENTGPNYKCPFIDIGWSNEKIRRVLKA